MPLAFRAGSAKRDRVHIFWQKRMREGDTQTPWWFPSETRGGLMDAARIALPIPPGLKWSDELPRLLPLELPVAGCQLPAEEKRSGRSSNRKSDIGNRKSPTGFYFGKPPAAESEKPAKPKRVKTNDPMLAAKARELRDRYLEQFNRHPLALGNEKYDVTRAMGNASADIGALCESSASVSRMPSLSCAA
ncbi:MAG: hypothetical protein QM770_08425 [Tepidisphaeraceae bacterium]